MKKMETMDGSKGRQDLAREAYILSTCRHPNIAEIYGEEGLLRMEVWDDLKMKVKVWQGKPTLMQAPQPSAEFQSDKGRRWMNRAIEGRHRGKGGWARCAQNVLWL